MMSMADVGASLLANSGVESAPWVDLSRASSLLQEAKRGEGKGRELAVVRIIPLTLTLSPTQGRGDGAARAEYWIDRLCLG